MRRRSSSSNPTANGASPPPGPRGLPGQTVDDAAQTAQGASDRRGARTERGGPAPVRLGPPLVPSPRPRGATDVRQDAASQVVPRREERPTLVGVDPVQPSAQPGLEGHVAVGLHHEGIEELTAEGLVAAPQRGGPAWRERGHVDRPGLDPEPLDRIRRRVALDEPLAERGQRDIELHTRRVPQHLERPLVGVGHQRHRLVTQDRGPAAVGCRGPLGQVHLLGGNEQPVALETVEEGRRRQSRPVLRGPGAQPAEHLALVAEHAMVGIANRARVEPGIRHRLVHAGARLDYPCLRKLATETAAPTVCLRRRAISWQSLLPGERSCRGTWRATRARCVDTSALREETR